MVSTTNKKYNDTLTEYQRNQQLMDSLLWRHDNDYDKSLLTKSDNELTWYDKATINMNPNIKSNRNYYRQLFNSNQWLGSQLTNLQSAQQILQDWIDKQEKNINKMYDLQNTAQRLSSEINWWASHAWWLWAWAGQMAQSRAAIDNQAFNNVLNNEAQRQSALANVAQQRQQIPTTMSSIAMNNANIVWAEAQANANNANADLIRKQASQIWKWSWGSRQWGNSAEETSEENYKTILRWMANSWKSEQEIRDYIAANPALVRMNMQVRKNPVSWNIEFFDDKQTHNF